MLIIADKRIPKEAKQELSKYAKLVEMHSTGIVEESVSGHTDIFITEIDNRLLLAPQTPLHIINALKEEDIDFEYGKSLLSNTYPKIAAYNTVITDKYLIHKLSITDEAIIDRCEDKTHINVSQGFTRCSLIALPNNLFITSDKGIEKALLEKKLEVLYLNPTDILLPGQKHGFIGGCAGVYNNTLFLLGSLKYYAEGDIFLAFLQRHNISYIELYDGKLFDGGSIFFV
jgi:Family of unknown function (DUF6873)